MGPLLAGRDVLLKGTGAGFVTWRIEDGQRFEPLAPDGMNEVFSADGRHLFAGVPWTGPVFVWRVGGSGKPIRELRSRWMLKSPDMRRLLVRDGDEYQVLATDDLSLVARVEIFVKDRFFSASFDATGDRLVVGDSHGAVHVWDLKHGGKTVLQAPATNAGESDRQRPGAPAAVRVLPAPSTDAGESGVFGVVGLPVHAIRKVGFSPEGRYVVAIRGKGYVRVLRADGQTTPAILEEIDMEDLVDAAEFSPDSARLLVTASKRAKLWRIDGSSGGLVLAGHRGTVSGGWIAGEEGRVWTTDSKSTARVWRVETPAPVVPRDTYKKIELSSDWQRSVTVGKDGTTKLWHRDGRAAQTLRGLGDGAHAIPFSKDGARVILDSGASTAVIRATKGNEGEVNLQGHTGRVLAASFSADGGRAITGSEDGTARVWAADGRELARLPHAAGVLAVAFAADGQRIVTGSSDGVARVWQPDGAGSTPVLQHRGPVLSVDFSPDGDRILAVTAREDEEGLFAQELWVRSAVGGDGRKALLKGISDDPIYASFTPDGRRVVAVTNYRVHLWFDVDAAPLILKGLANPVSIAVSADSTRLATVDALGHANIWPICSPAECIEALWRATSYCLSAKERGAMLGEGEREAADNVAACRRRVDGWMAQGVYR